MDEQQKAKFKLKKLVRELGSYHARHTELISVYVPAGYSMQNILNQLSTEAGTARNIKSTGTRKNVTAALEKMIQHLRLYKQTPAHGLAIFSGNVAEREGVQDIRVWAIEPYEPLKIKIYQCNQTFFLEPLKEQLIAKSTYGLVVMDRREADIALLKGKAIVPVVSLKSFVPGKFKVGGQSAARMSRIVENVAKDWYEKVGEHINKIFAKTSVNGIIVGGPGPTKEDLVNGEFINIETKKKIIGIKNIGYTGDFGLNELVEKSEDLLTKEAIVKERQAVEQLLALLGTKPGLVVYGEEEVKEAINSGSVETLLISEDIPEERAEEIIEKAEESGADAILISKDTREGQQLIGLGSIAAILRYAKN